MAALSAPSEAVWLAEGEAPHDQAKMGVDASVQTRGYRHEAAAAFPSVIGGPGSDFI
jgi:hypothetical protein